MIKYLKTRWKTGVLALLMVAVTAGILFLYDIPLEPVGYVAVFEMLLTGLGLMWDYHKYRKKQESLLYIRDCGNFSEEYLRLRRMKMRLFTGKSAVVWMRRE